ncbi:hypothetical protein G6F55_007903 [Rhizopus delemar]|uniref:HTH APSES-type domain-containing protein n=1 Tax=Rhizopus delemar (strain RA 99-880 / ATCC MYA-4621 / FGSC 9543 / NRRL 43880) TaxID=246409 RepID=I1BNG2_RHIO9|nr:hypothetical protein RO3G_02446 [Rhizopus delemar RA 99-880]KAG1453882.1 hypothetical protein G6F55_007903 [Rhizopus delemar]KAG1492590.1 hypothetical protein G6F54_009199 [Rhizopus delemar]KAG1625764.1 hypothetical protein G6F45_008915 [Rhizopus arrhizus]|eukprot:EIE77742.1 hypothetical protein RO3G_02446 [Rhizopus delemar RA 99-880]
MFSPPPTLSSIPKATTPNVIPTSNYFGSSSHNPITHNQAKFNTNTHYYPYTQPQRPLVSRPRLTTTLWEDEGTVCYQVDVNGICVARRQDNDMINGTKLLNVTGMTRGKRDGILKNEKGRVVIKVGAMHLKGVWIPFDRARSLAIQYKIHDLLHPLFADDPTVFLYYHHKLTPYYNRQSQLPPFHWNQPTSSYTRNTNSSGSHDLLSQLGYRSPPTLPNEGSSAYSYSSKGQTPLPENDGLYEEWMTSARPHSDISVEDPSLFDSSRRQSIKRYTISRHHPYMAPNKEH